MRSQAVCGSKRRGVSLRAGVCLVEGAGRRRTSRHTVSIASISASRYQKRLLKRCSSAVDVLDFEMTNCLLPSDGMGDETFSVGRRKRRRGRTIL